MLPPVEDAQPSQSTTDAMEIDEGEVSLPKIEPPTSPQHISHSHSPIPVDITQRSSSAAAPTLTERQATPKFCPSPLRTPLSEAKADVTTKGTEDLVHTQPSPVTTVDDIDVQSSTQVAVPKIEDMGEDVLGDAPADPPLPLGRVDSEHSTAEYVLDHRIAPDRPPPLFEFSEKSVTPIPLEEKTIAPSLTLYKPLSFTLPPLKILPPEFSRKGKQRQTRKRDKEKTEMKTSQEWAPMGLNKWCAILRANPVHKKVSKASKCLSTRDWNVGFYTTCIRNYSLKLSRLL